MLKQMKKQKKKLAILVLLAAVLLGIAAEWMQKQESHFKEKCKTNKSNERCKKNKRKSDPVFKRGRWSRCCGSGSDSGGSDWTDCYF